MYWEDLMHANDRYFFKDMNCYFGSHVCFTGLVLMSFEDEDEIEESIDVKSAKTLYEKLVKEGRMPAGLKLKMKVNCCS